MIDDWFVNREFHMELLFWPINTAKLKNIDLKLFKGKVKKSAAFFP